MRWIVFIALQCLIVLAIVGVVFTHQDKVIVLKKPPLSLAQWYKPQNKRQVWLHTMFKLRREMLAVEIYASTGDSENLQKWAGKLDKDYQKISEMVPEWQNHLNLDAIEEIQKSAQESRFEDVSPALKNLGESCKTCHTDYRAVTAAMYRAPDFLGMDIDASTSLNAHMQTLSKQVNQIKIAFVDERHDDALSAFSDLSEGMNTLGDTCINCHKKATQPYPNAEVSQALSGLGQSLESGTLQDKGRALGTLAVMACANCHATHRLSYDAKILFSEEKSWSERLKH
ncbi:MAG: cytochrome c [Rhodospirillales bacterium]|jgi:cytochrome c556|nr:cytochrome c [Rhodospirillales bacterium]